MKASAGKQLQHFCFLNFFLRRGPDASFLPELDYSYLPAWRQSPEEIHEHGGFVLHLMEDCVHEGKIPNTIW